MLAYGLDVVNGLLGLVSSLVDQVTSLVYLVTLLIGHLLTHSHTTHLICYFLFMRYFRCLLRSILICFLKYRRNLI